MTKNAEPIVRSLARVREWTLNPRRGKYEGIDEMMESLRLYGLQDAIHVWEREDGDYLLKGHRRYAAMRQLGWTECRQVVLRFADEAEAYQYLLEDHGHTMSLNVEEKVTAVENGVRLGLTTEELAPRLGMTEKRVQIYFDLGEMLPARGREALATGDLSLNVAEMLLPLKGAPRSEVEQAVQLLLHDPVNDEPLSPKAAEMLIQRRFVLPKKYEAEWLKMSSALRKKQHLVSDGYAYVDFKDRLEYVMGETGQPHSEFAQSHEVEGRQTWGEKAQALGVPVYVCPAPLHADKYVLLVSKKMVREALKAQDGSGDAPAPAEAEKARPAAASEPIESEAEPTEEDKMPFRSASEEDRLGRWLKVYLSAIYEHLLVNPTDCMSQGPWALMHAMLAHEVTDVDEGAMKAWLGLEDAASVLAEIQKDTKSRNAMRWTLLLLLCLDADLSSQPETHLRRMAEEFGLNTAQLDALV